MPYKSKERMQDKQLWDRMGWELYVLNALICSISADRDYQSVMVCRTWDRFGKMLYDLGIIRSQAEERMARFNPAWSVRTFYPIAGSDDIKAAVAEFRRKVKESVPAHD